MFDLKKNELNRWEEIKGDKILQDYGYPYPYVDTGISVGSGGVYVSNAKTGNKTQTSTFNSAASGNMEPNDKDKNKGKDKKKGSDKKIDKSREDHMFRDSEGHFKENTVVNRKLIEDVANNNLDYQGTDQFGNQWYT